MIHGVLGSCAITPPSGEPVWQGCPKREHMGKHITCCLAILQHQPEKHPWRLETIWNLYTNYQASHSVRPYRITFWYHRPCHFCHSPVSTRPEEEDDGWPWWLEVPVEDVALSEGWAIELTVPRFAGPCPKAVASSAFRFASCCALALSNCFRFSSICLR